MELLLKEGADVNVANNVRTSASLRFLAMGILNTPRLCSLATPHCTRQHIKGFQDACRGCWALAQQLISNQLCVTHRSHDMIEATRRRGTGGDIFVGPSIGVSCTDPSRMGRLKLLSVPW